MNGGKGAIKYVIAVTVLGVIGFVACQGYVFIEEPKHQTGTQRNFIPIETISKADIIFLVDNSGSMAQEQENLAANFADFIKEVLKGQNDFHIGLVTTDVNFNPLTECKPGGACPNGMGCVQATTPSGAVKAGTYYCVTP
ncbi:MAG: VWA domain-containing protein, partial [Deltaproteobacteria bacterium]|nr:VWA domain-containing protein [Deltaproteobacteria bacterium]